MDSTKAQTTKGSHIYYRIIKDYYLKKDSYKIEEYYKSGKLKQEGISTEKDVYKYFGFLTSYYETGGVEEKITYEDSQPQGPCFSWYENGKKRSEGRNFLDTKAHAYIYEIDQYWDKDGNQKVTNGYGTHDEIKGKISLSGPLVKGRKDGIWKGSDKNLKIQFTETYQNGEFISGTSIDENLVERKYTKISEKPDAINGMKDFNDFIGKNFKTPKNETISGRIFVSFFVSKEGFIKDIKILRGLNEEIDNEALRVVGLYNKKWKAGKSRGIDVDVKYACPINIK